MARPRGKRKQARISVSFEDADYATVCALARDRDVSVAWMVRQAVHGLIEREKIKGADLQLPLIPQIAKRDYTRS